MKLEEIQSLIKFVAKSGVSEVELEMNDVKILIKTPPKGVKGVETTTLVQAPVMGGMPGVQMQAMPAQAAAPVAPEPKAAVPPAAPAEAESSNYIEVKSPMIGTFYRSPSPDKPSFINVGDDVKVGDPVCIIEAMKLFNEIESEVSGKIVKILVDDTSPVEYDQPLFLVDPS